MKIRIAVAAPLRDDGACWLHPEKCGSLVLAQLTRDIVLPPVWDR